VRLVVKRSDNGQTGKYKAQEGTADIPHEQVRLGEVEKEKSQSSCRNCITDDIGKIASLGDTDKAEKQTGDDGCSPGYPIDAIHEVESIGQPDNPEEGESVTDKPDFHAAGPWQGDFVNYDSEGHDG